MPQLSFPRPFGRYTLLANLAQGGMGALYVACVGDPGMEKLCVIKTVLPHLADKEYVARFRDEAKVVVRLSHGNLVPVLDAGIARVEGSDELYLAIEYVDGKDLRAVWNQCARKGIAFPVDIAVYIARELCRGLHHAHTASGLNLVHRDVSPPNVLLSFAGEVKLTDFGLAASTMKTEKTQPGVIYGKVSYMSPEQARGEPLDGRTDLFAVGVILWELLTGTQLFPQAEPNLIARVRNPKIDPPSHHAERVPTRLDVVVLKALERDRTLRYAHCDAFRAALSEYLAETAPATDNTRVCGFLEQLFGDEIDKARAARQEMIAGVHHARPTPAGALAPAAEPTPQTNDLIGAYLDGRYLVKRLIGEGGMGFVFEAEHAEIGRRVAIKLLRSHYTRQAELVARFRSEARAATRIGNPHIIDVFDSGTTVDGAVFFVMEFLEGGDLGKIMAADAPFPLDRTLTIAREIALALAAAHKAGIVHRDLKPENVFLIERDGMRDFVKVLDFGIAKTLGDSGRVGHLTNPHLAMGTPEYMAPEQATSGAIDHRADIYALGAIVYEMLAGRPPHQGANVLDILTKKATETPIAVGQFRTDTPAELERLVMRMLALQPAERPQSMEQVAEELAALLEEEKSALTPPPPVERKRRAPLLAAVGGTALAVAVGGWLAVRSRAAAVAVAEPTRPLVAASGVPAGLVPAKAAGSESGVPPASPAAAERTDGKPPRAHPRHVAAPRPAPAAAASPPKTSAPVPEPFSEGHQALKDGRVALRAGRYAEAEAQFHRAEAAGTEHAQALTALADVAFQRGQYADAALRAQRAVQAGGGTMARMLLGNSYFKLKRYDEAIAQYRAVLTVDHGNAEALQNLAAAERRKGGG